jgi:hypothetical protein
LSTDGANDLWACANFVTEFFGTLCMFRRRNHRLRCNFRDFTIVLAPLYNDTDRVGYARKS